MPNSFATVRSWTTRTRPSIGLWWATMPEPQRLTLDSANPCNDKLTTSLRVTVAQASAGHPAGVANTGYWGIPVQPHTRYRATLLARAEPGFSGPVTVSIVSEDGRVVYAKEKLSGLTPQWGRFQTTLKTGRCQTHSESLFPHHSRPTRNRLARPRLPLSTDLERPPERPAQGPDADARGSETQSSCAFRAATTSKVKQSRPGSNGRTPSAPSKNATATRVPGAIARPTAWDCLEFLEWCEDMQAEPVLGVYAGYSLRGDARQSRAGPRTLRAGGTGEDRIRDRRPQHPVGRASGKGRSSRALPPNLRRNRQRRRVRQGEELRRPLRAVLRRHQGEVSTRSNSFPPLPNRPMSFASSKADMVDLHFYSSTDEFIRMSRDYGAQF